MSYFLFILFVGCGIVAAVAARKLTTTAAITGGIIGTFIFIGVGWPGIFLMTCFFITATIATSWKKKVKQTLGIAQENGEKRNAGQVLANGGVAGILGMLAIFFPQHTSLFLMLIAASFSSATADTVSSELGSVYGRKFYDIISLKKGQRGVDGVVSWEGSLLGMTGSCMIGVVYAMAEGWDSSFYWLVLAGTIGNLTDSLLGATLERKGIIGNDAVNFLNTAVAAMVAFVLCKI